MESKWKYNAAKHSVDEQPTMREPEVWKYRHEVWLEMHHKWQQHLASLRHIPVSGTVDWADGEDVTGKFTIKTEHPGLYEKDYAIPIKQEQPQERMVGGSWLNNPQSQEQPVESEDDAVADFEKYLETATMWCEVVHAVLEAHKKGEEIGNFIPDVLEKQFTIKRKT